MSRSSNSPRYFAPATIAPRSSDDQPLAAQGLRHVAGDDALGQALDDGGLADAGLADQHGVVLGAPRQHLDDAADLGVAADDRVELAVAGGAAVRSTPYFSSAWKVPSGSGAGDPRRAAHRLAARRPAPSAWRRAACSTSATVAVLRGQGEQQVLGRDVLVAAVAGLALGGVEDGEQRRGRLRRGDGGAAGARAARRPARWRVGAHGQRVGADGLQQRAGQALGVVEQGDGAGGPARRRGCRARRRP